MGALNWGGVLITNFCSEGVHLFGGSAYQRGCGKLINYGTSHVYHMTHNIYITWHIIFISHDISHWTWQRKQRSMTNIQNTKHQTSSHNFIMLHFTFWPRWFILLYHNTTHQIDYHAIISIPFSSQKILISNQHKWKEAYSLYQVFLR